MKNTVTRDQIEALMAASQVDVCTKFDKVTVVTVKLPNGFVLVEASGAIDKANYSESMGAKICLERIATKLWQFEGYVLSTRLAEAALEATAETLHGECDCQAYVGLPVAEVKELAGKASALVSQIELCGASAALTTAVVAAADLAAKLNGLASDEAPAVAATTP